MRRIAVVACVLLVTLRLAIGWQLLYEGLWKIKTLSSPQPWTSAGYLRNSQGPLRSLFRSLAEDPDDLDWLDVEKTAAKWDQWHRSFVKHYRLDDRQKGNLNRWINGSKTFEVDVESIPEGYNSRRFNFVAEAGQQEFLGADKAATDLQYDVGLVNVKVNNKGLKASQFTAVDGKTVVLKLETPLKKGDQVQVVAGGRLKKLKLDTVVSFNTEKKRLVVDGQKHLKPEEREALVTAFRSDGHEHLVEPAKAVYKKSKDGISYKEKLAATLRGNPDWVSDKDAQRLGEVDKYKSMLVAYESDLAKADQDFRWDHLNYTWGEIQAQRASLVGPVKALETEMKEKAVSQLRVEQMAYGPVWEPLTKLRTSDLMTVAGLTILGAMLILGLGTRLAAILAAVMLFMFYAAMPPWPGLPEIPGPEHSFIVNKNFIEIVALLAIAALPSGRWFGMDAMLGWLWKRKQDEEKTDW